MSISFTRLLTIALAVMLFWLLISFPHALRHHHSGFASFRLLFTVGILLALLYLIYRSRTGQQSPAALCSHTDRSAKELEVCPQKVRRLLTYLDQQHPYLDDSLTLPALADQLDEPVHHISRTINLGLGMSYSELINQRRVEWARRLLRTQPYRQAKIMAVAWDAGFTSKSAFYTAFKKYTGLSPTAYRRQYWSGQI